MHFNHLIIRFCKNIWGIPTVWIDLFRFYDETLTGLHQNIRSHTNEFKCLNKIIELLNNTVSLGWGGGYNLFSVLSQYIKEYEWDIYLDLKLLHMLVIPESIPFSILTRMYSSNTTARLKHKCFITYLEVI